MIYTIYEENMILKMRPKFIKYFIYSFHSFISSNFFHCNDYAKRETFFQFNLTSKIFLDKPCYFYLGFQRGYDNRGDERGGGRFDQGKCIVPGDPGEVNQGKREQ